MSRYKVNGEAREGSLGYQPYPNYKESGVAWLGEVPEHWEVGLLSSLFVDNKEKNAGMKNNNLLSLSYGRIIQKDIDTNEGLLPESFESYQIVHPGYIVLRLTDLQNDKKSLRTGFVKETGIITSAYTGLAKKSKSIGDERYFHLYLHTFDLHKGFYGMGAGVRQGLNFDELKKLKFLLPPTNEQTLIANFLDRETAKIDTLIAKQERMIELLNEKRSALISHAVTKGIDPNAKMKDSGVEWLGEVPEHWEVTKIGVLSDKIGSGKTPKGGSEVYLSEGVVFIRSQNVYDEGLRLDDVVFISEKIDEEMKNTRVQPGDILLNITGASIGRTALVPEDFINANVNQHVCIIRINDPKFRPFVSLVMKSNFVKNQIDMLQNGAAREGLNFEQIANILLVLPPVNEQLKISSFLEDKTAKIDTLIAKARQAIELMKERRTALISAAVTGKIDVRGMA